MRPIEYVGASPVKKKKVRNPFGGWLLVVAALGLAFYFVRPLVLKAQPDSTSATSVKETAEFLRSRGRSGDLVVARALERTQEQVAFDVSYYQIDFPNGDLKLDRGKAEDLVVRAYRAIEVDLQLLVHEDLKANYYSYPQIFDQDRPDTNVDHRRVQNLQRFFERDDAWEVIDESKKPEDFEVGDVVIWQLLNGDKHIGFVAPGPGRLRDDKWVVHNIGGGPAWEDRLLDHRVEGHYRYQK